MKVKKTKSGSVKIDPIALNAAKVICKSKGIIISSYITNAVIKENKSHGVARNTNP